MNKKENLMTAGQSRLVSVAELLDYDLAIPPFQRPYDWEATQVEELIADLDESRKKDVPLFLGLIVACVNSADELLIIDGQQRLTTLMLAIAAVGDTDAVLRNSGGVSRLWITPRRADVSFTKSLFSKLQQQEKTLSQRRLSEAYGLLAAQAERFKSRLAECQVILYVSPSLSGATGLFERINLRGKEVSQFDLVKNKLIEWCAIEKNSRERTAIEELITSRYDELYQRLDPPTKVKPYDSDKLLKIHWIIFGDKSFKSSDRVLEKLDEALHEEFSGTGRIGGWIERYLNSLVEVTEVWCAVERPYYAMPQKYSEGLRRALLDFARLDRDGELQPLIVAAIIRWRDQAEGLVRFCEIDSFRSALAKKNSNSGRSAKWRFAKLLYQLKWKDKLGADIVTSAAAAHQLYWASTPYLSPAEAKYFGMPQSTEQVHAQIFPVHALESTKFHVDYRRVIHYLFWKYGTYLPKSKTWGKDTREDISPFQENAWFGEAEEFQKWDIEHIYPRNPSDAHTKDGKSHMKKMQPWLNHVGNLTVLPIRDNRGIGNALFIEKLAWLKDQKKVSFNELMSKSDYRGNLSDKPRWGPNNCRKRSTQIIDAFNEIWGTEAIKKLGVGKWDARIENYDQDDDVE